MGWPHPNPMIMHATFSQMESKCSLLSPWLFSGAGILFDRLFSILRFLLKLSVWVAQQLLSFYVDSLDILNSYDREDTSAVELEAILVTVKPKRPIRPYLVREPYRIFLAVLITTLHPPPPPQLTMQICEDNCISISYAGPFIERKYQKLNLASIQKQL